MEKAIITAFMTLAAVVCAVLLFSAVYPAIANGSAAVVSMGDRISDRLRSQVVIIHAVADGSVALVWVKNVGSDRIADIEGMDVFFGPEGDFARVPYGSASGNPYWEWQLENDTDWNPTATLRITVHTDTLLSGRYFVKVVTPVGVSSDLTFSQ